METNIICLQSNAFYRLLDEVVQHINNTHKLAPKKWLLTDEAMELLGISSKTTLQNLRDTGKIRFSQPQKKIILYDIDSIHTYLEQNARNTF